LLDAVDETENVVVDIVAALSVGQKLECLSVVHGLLFLVDLYFRDGQYEAKLSTSVMSAYQKGAGNEDEDTAVFIAGLGIESCDLMLNLLEGEFLWQRREALDSRVGR
jgi:hypothetical protein